MLGNSIRKDGSRGRDGGGMKGRKVTETVRLARMYVIFLSSSFRFI